MCHFGVEFTVVYCFLASLLSCHLSLCISILSSLHVNLSFLPPPPHSSAGQSSLKLLFHRTESWKHWGSWDTMWATCPVRKTGSETSQAEEAFWSFSFLICCLIVAYWIYTHNIKLLFFPKLSRNSKMSLANDFWHSHLSIAGTVSKIWLLVVKWAKSDHWSVTGSLLLWWLLVLQHFCYL